MGADLYLEGLSEPTRRKWQPRFEAAVAERDRHAQGTPEHEHWHRRVLRYYDKMYAVGYFRDPYNAREVLAKFGLSWWTDVVPLVNGDGYLPVVDTAHFLEHLEEREATFRQSLAELSARDARYFRQRAQALKAFLRTAIERAEPIRCSV
jgi:hypothetical protein